MRVCCIDLSIAARMIGFYGLVVGAVVMVEMSTEMGRVECSLTTIKASMNGEDVTVGEEELSGGAAMSAWLLGLSLNEFGSRLRHSMHTGRDMPAHVHVHSTAQDPPHLHLHKPPVTEAPKRNQTQDLRGMETEKQLYIGFLLFAIMYASTSALLMFGSVAEVRWTAVPWLIAHLGTVSAQTAGLVVQVTAAVSQAPENDHLAPGHPDEAHVDEDDYGGTSAPGPLILSVVNMLFLVYMWIVVIVAMRSWKRDTHLTMSTKPAPGDESYALSNLGSYSYSQSKYSE